MHRYCFNRMRINKTRFFTLSPYARQLWRWTNKQLVLAGSLEAIFVVVIILIINFGHAYILILAFIECDVVTPRVRVDAPLR